MPQTIDDVVYYLFGAAIVVDEDGNPAENLTGGVVSLPGSVDPLTVLDVVTLAERTTITTGPLSFVSAHLVPIPDDLALMVTVDWPGDNIPPQEWYADPSEYVAASPAALAALAAAAEEAQEAADAAKVAAVAAQEAAEAALEEMEGHTHDLDALTDVDTVTTAPADGDALVYDAGISKWRPGDPPGDVDPYVETLATAPAGSVFRVNYYDDVLSPIDTWPPTRASLFPDGAERFDVYLDWRGPTDPGSRVGPHDDLHLVGPPSA